MYTQMMMSYHRIMNQLRLEWSMTAPWNEEDNSTDTEAQKYTDSTEDTIQNTQNLY